MNQYASEAERSQDVHLSKKKLQDLELKKVLLNLLMWKVVYQTPEDRYVIARTLNLPGLSQTFAASQAASEILAVLASRGGQYNVDELQREITKDGRVSVPDYLTAINVLITNTEVTIEKDHKLWSASHPAPPDKRQKEK